MTQFSQQFSFQCFHFLGLIVVDVVVAQQVQATVDDQVRPVGVERLALFGGFALDHGDADHQVAQQRDVEQFIRHVGREGQHVGGVVFASPGEIQFTAFGFIDQTNGHFRIGRALAQGQLAPLAELLFARVVRIACQLQIELKHRVVCLRSGSAAGCRSARRLRQSAAPTGGGPRPWVGSA
ncbi:hypothetical protein D3C81_1470040 [compost metagenome]